MKDIADCTWDNGVHALFRPVQPNQSAEVENCTTFLCSDKLTPPRLC